MTDIHQDLAMYLIELEAILAKPSGQHNNDITCKQVIQQHHCDWIHTSSIHANSPHWVWKEAAPCAAPTSPSLQTGKKCLCECRDQLGSPTVRMDLAPVAVITQDKPSTLRMHIRVHWLANKPIVSDLYFVDLESTSDIRPKYRHHKQLETSHPRAWN